MESLPAPVHQDVVRRLEELLEQRFVEASALTQDEQSVRRTVLNELLTGDILRIS